MAIVAVRALFLDPDETPASGEIIFEPRYTVRDPVTGEWLITKKAFKLDDDGYLGGVAGVDIRTLEDIDPDGFYLVTLDVNRSRDPLKGVLRLHESDVAAGVELSERLEFMTIPPAPPLSSYVLSTTFAAHTHTVAAEDTLGHVIPDGSTIVVNPATGVMSATSGTGDKYEVYNQLVPAAIWNINHSLNKVPVVYVVDSGGSIVQGDVSYPGFNQVRIEFAYPFGGTAYLS